MADTAASKPASAAPPNPATAQTKSADGVPQSIAQELLNLKEIEVLEYPLSPFETQGL